ncbi:Hpt domain-containing protein [Alteromonas sp. KUL49]|uniref:Hpt domain-containing protein n=1 Tax=Alteromonas sp. KUL49 TaxID=2480798 RepID=UPI00102F1C6F|nr:Hpt domain-containing protein [Alteromonas sp. KUL49]TAP40783.1 Hpt domain-containing protein [Alteromonas sp. KUL49]GEA10956.1 hypothetical protein KUL49_13310 [Alteromonas sp. KUL49]
MSYSPNENEIKDPDVLSRLEAEVGDALLNDLINLFISETQSLHTQLIDSLASAKNDDATRFAHSIKSGARTYGANALADSAAIVESALRENDVDLANQNMSNLHAMLLATVEQYS